MDKTEFSDIRRYLGKTQKQIAHLMGTSGKAVESFEQGWRRVPVHIERQMLFLLARSGSEERKEKCWKMQKCPMSIRLNCPAWEFQIGTLCWFINGTICHGEVQESWEEKMKMCRQCEVLTSLLPLANG